MDANNRPDKRSNNNTDSALKRAQERSRLGLPRVLQVPRTDNAADPSHGGSTGYNIHKRADILTFAAANSVSMAAQEFGVSRSTIYRWIERSLPCHQTGNKEREILVGKDQLILAISLFLYPRASADEHCAFIASRGGKVYSRKQFYARCRELGITKKKSSLEARQAYTPRNLLRNELFWTRQPPLGIHGLPKYSLCDTDEAGFTLQSVETKYGQGYCSMRVQDVGHYTRTNRDYFLLLMTVEPGNPNLPDEVYGSIANPRKWWRIVQGSCNQHIFADYMDYVCRSIEENPLPNNYDSQKFFMWDNLSVHKTDLVLATIELRESIEDHQFCVVRRPPYRPRIAPIEYIFCEINTILSRQIHSEWTPQNLELEINNACLAVGNNGGIDRTFTHCGY